MSQEARPAAEGTAAASLAEVPVRLDFEIGNLSVSVGQLASLKAGYVFKLRGRSDAVPVIIRANGTKVGHGELVAVGDSLGVQLLAIDSATADTQPRPERAASR